MLGKIDESRLRVYKNPDVADRINKILESIDELGCCVHDMYGALAATDVLTTTSLKVVSSVLIDTIEPEKYELVCREIGNTLYKTMVAEKKIQDARGKGEVNDV